MKNDIENTFDDYHLDISKIGKYEKFVEFSITEKTCDGIPFKDIQFKEVGGLFRFKSDSLKCEKISKEEKIKSLKNMLCSLHHHIRQEIEKELSKIRNDLQTKYDEKYNVNSYLDKINKLKLKISEASQHSS